MEGMTCNPRNQYASLTKQVPPHLPSALWFPDLHRPRYTIHSDSLVAMKIGMFIELEKSCHLCFSSEVS